MFIKCWHDELEYRWRFRFIPLYHINLQNWHNVAMLFCNMDFYIISQLCHTIVYSQASRGDTCFWFHVYNIISFCTLHIHLNNKEARLINNINYVHLLLEIVRKICGTSNKQRQVSWADTTHVSVVKYNCTVIYYVLFY